MTRHREDDVRNGVSAHRLPWLAQLLLLLAACVPPASSSFPRGPADAWRLDAAPGCAGRRSHGWSVRAARPVPRPSVRCVTVAEATPPAPRAAEPPARPSPQPAPAFPRDPAPSPPAPAHAPPDRHPPTPTRSGHVPTSGLDADAIVALEPAACRSVLEAAGVAVETALDAPETVAQPVRVVGPIGGVELRLAWSRDPAHDVHAVFDCRLVVALLPAVALVEAAGYDTLEYVSATRRGGGRRSMHRLGLAADLVAVRKGEHRWNVEELYRRGGVERCRRGRMPADVFGRILCRGWRERWFHTILGPDHDRAHHDHLHVDLAPHRRRPSTPYVGLRGGSAGDLPRTDRPGRP